MPRVGNKHFSYSPKGRAAANAYARTAGKKVTNKTHGTCAGTCKCKRKKR